MAGIGFRVVEEARGERDDRKSEKNHLSRLTDYNYTTWWCSGVVLVRCFWMRHHGGAGVRLVWVCVYFFRDPRKPDVCANQPGDKYS